MTQQAILEVSGLSKRYCRDFKRSLRYGITDMAREFLPLSQSQPKLRRDEFWAVDDISFTINRGEAVAIAGRNGAGKTTLMRLLAGILKPDKGEIRLNGRVNPVIELGQGLNPLLTGRENAALGVAWRGVARRIIEPLVEEIEAFSDLGEHFEKPINQYSAGMRVRLAFAIAAHVPADLMVLDEVLAVGDLAFQHKCMRKMRQHIDLGGSLVLVSHNNFQMQAICRRGLLIEDGRTIFDGSVEQCISHTLDTQFSDPVAPGNKQARDPRTPEILGLSVSPETGQISLRPGENLNITVHFETAQPRDVLFVASIWSADGSLCLAQLADDQPVELRPGAGQKSCCISNLPLAHGRYSAKAVLIDPDTMLGIATFGYDNAPVPFMVEDDISRLAVLERDAGQVLKLQSSWSGACEPEVQKPAQAKLNQLPIDQEGRCDVGG